jgi:hypothetical protein
VSSSVTTFAIDPRNPSVLYAGTECDFSDPKSFQGLFKSIDGGITLVRNERRGSHRFQGRHLGHLMEMRPGTNPALTHHYCVFVVPHKADVEYGKFSDTSQGQATGGAPFEGCYEKGQEEFDYRPQHAGRLIPANSDMIFQMH